MSKDELTVTLKSPQRQSPPSRFGTAMTGAKELSTAHQPGSIGPAHSQLFLLVCMARGEARLHGSVLGGL